MPQKNTHFHPEDYCPSESRQQWKKQPKQYKIYTSGVDQEQIQQLLPLEMLSKDNNGLPIHPNSPRFPSNNPKTLLLPILTDEEVLHQHHVTRKHDKNYRKTFANSYKKQCKALIKLNIPYLPTSSSLDLAINEHALYLKQANTLANTHQEPHYTILTNYFFENLSPKTISDKMNLELALVQSIISNAEDILRVNYQYSFSPP